MDDGLQALGALAEYVVNKNKTEVYAMTGADPAQVGHPAKLWTEILVAAEVYLDKLRDRSGKARETVVGQFLSATSGEWLKLGAPQPPGQRHCVPI